MKCLKTVILWLILLILYNNQVNCNNEQLPESQINSVPLEKKLKCIYVLEAESLKNQLHIKVRKLFIDTLKLWKKQKLLYSNYDNYFIEYIHPTICFNKNKDKALIFILRVDTGKSDMTYFINYICCYKEKDNWEFYANLYPNGLKKSQLNEKYPIASKKVINKIELSQLEAYLHDIIAANYFSDEKCSINDKFVDYKLGGTNFEDVKYKQKLLSVPTKIKLKCVEKLEQESLANPLYSEVRSLFLDTLNDWKKKGLKYINALYLMYENIDPIICFNSEKNRCILFYLKIDKDKKAVFDYIDYIIGIYEGSNWHFYINGIVGMPIAKTELYKEYPKAKKMISGVNFGRLEAYLREMIAVNYFLDGECTIHDDYVNRWYKKDTPKKHEEFLQNK